MDELSELRVRLAGDRAAGVGVAVLLLALGGFVLWATVAPLTEGVVGSGVVVVDTEHKIVQHLEGGIVARLHVHEGSTVQQGDVLIELSQTQARAQLDLLESRYYSRLAEIDRLEAERLLHEELRFSAALLQRREDARIADILSRQQELFTVRRSQYLGQVEILRYRIAQLEARIRGLEASREAKSREQALIERDLSTLRELYRQQLVDEGRLLLRQQEYERNIGHINSIAADIAAARVTISEARQEIIQLGNTLRTQASDRIAEAQQEHFEIQEQIASIQDVLSRTRIVAPQAGKVLGLSVHTLGAVIPPGQPILHIVPSAARLMVQGQIRPVDIDNVYPGQEARLRFSAFSSRTTPELKGHVERVSADALQHSETQESYYVARILVSEQELEKLGTGIIGPGMPVEIMFTGSSRTAMQYLLDPLHDILNKALVEE